MGGEVTLVKLSLTAAAVHAVEERCGGVSSIRKASVTT